MLRNLASDKPKRWDSALAQAEFAYNNMNNISTGLPLFVVVYTKAPNLTTDLAANPKGHLKLANTFA